MFGIGNRWQLSKFTEYEMTLNDFERMNWSNSRNRCYQTLCSSLATDDVASTACCCDVALLPDAGRLNSLMRRLLFDLQLISGRFCGGVACDRETFLLLT